MIHVKLIEKNIKHAENKVRSESHENLTPRGFSELKPEIGNNPKNCEMKITAMEKNASA